MICRKVIIPVAGYGTRRLPITKAIEKCMLPVLNRPVIDYIVQDCIAAGITEFYFVVGEDCQQLRQYYEHNVPLELRLRETGKEELLPLVIPPANCSFHFVVQTPDLPYGTSVPVWLCRELVEAEEKVLVIMGDQFMFNADGSSEITQFLQQAESVVADSAMLGVKVPDEETSKYGIIASEIKDGANYFMSIAEKPAPGTAPSNLMNASIYLFDKDFFGFLEKEMKISKIGEHVITDPLNAYVQAGHTLAVIGNTGNYLDCGTVEGWLDANQQVWRAANRQARAISL